MHYSTENKTIVFNKDSTFIDAETIDKLARAIGVVSEEITKRAICGGLSFGQVLSEWAKLLKRLRLEIAYNVVNKIHHIPGVADPISYARGGRFRISIISGGFVIPVETVVGVDFFISFCQRCNKAQHVDIEQ